MTEILLLLFLLIVIFLSILWPVKKAAQWWGAERSGYGSAAIALAVSMLAMLLPQIILQQYLSPLVLLGINLIITAGIFASILGTDFVRGLGITVVSNLIGLSVLAAIVLMVSSLDSGHNLIPADLNPFVDHEQQAADIEQAANRVCDCKADRNCQQKRFAELTILIAQQGEDANLGNGDYQMGRARGCVNYYRRQAPVSGTEPPSETAPKPQSTDPSSSATIEQSTEQSTGQRRIQPPITIINSPHKARWSYLRVDVSDADSYLYETVRVTRRDNGKVIEGRLSPTKRSNVLAVRQRRYSGTIIMEIPKNKVRKLELRISSSPP